MADMLSWPAWAVSKAETLSREEARRHLILAQGFWRDFALAGLTVPELETVIEERRRKGPGGKIALPAAKTPSRPKPQLCQPDNSLFANFPPLDPEEERWLHA